MMRPLCRSHSWASFFSLLLSYLLVISLCVPFTLKRVMAAPVKLISNVTAASSSIIKAGKKKGPRRDNQLLIRFGEGVTEQQKSALVGEKGARRAKRLKGRSRVEKLELLQGLDIDAVAAQLRQNPAVEMVEPNFIISRDQAITPGDPRFSEQWALHNTGATGGQPGADIQVMSAWETTTGASATVIAVIDSGIDFTHPDLINNQWTNNREQANNTDDDNNGLANDLHGWDWVTGSGVIRDEQGHGTNVAGIIAAQGNNSIGITGVMWRASLISLRVLDNTGTGDVADAVEAIDYAVEHGAQVINCSWGTDEESIALKDAIERAGTSGVVIVSSSGNSGRDIESEPYYPSSFGLSNQIVVASTDNFDHLASWSNYGATHVTVAAPGKDILTTRRGGQYTTVTGTSASTPLVTGVVGLIKTQRWWLSAPGTRAAIVNGARRVEGLNGKVSSGGVVSAGGALGALQGPNTPPPGSGSGNNPPAQPPILGQDSGGNGQSGGFSTTPPPVTQDVPGSSLPNLDEVRIRQPTTPRAPRPIHADLCPDCDPGGGTPPPAGGSDPYFATARTRPQNETGQAGIDLGSLNFNWSLPLVSLPGRAGFDLNLAITYNSLVWTKQGTSIMFNADRGFPSPGFQLGVPKLETQFTNQDDPIAAYLMVLPSGGRVQMRRIGTSNVYESIDSTYTQLIDDGLSNGGSAVVRTKDGIQYKFSYPPGVTAVRCTQIKDRNGNFISIGYNLNAQVSTITDTLKRVATFNYTGEFLTSITQDWNGQTHVWATFGYGNLPMSASFPGLTYLGPQGSITVLNQIGLPDGTRYNFSYTSYGQVYKIAHYAADQRLLNYTGYNLPGSDWLGFTAQSDCPRFTERHDWAENWNNNQEAITYYSVDPNSAGGEQPAWSQVKTPDGTVHKELFATTGWQKGLTTGTEVWVGSVKKKWTTTDWTQDDISLTYQKNPRPSDMSVYDENTNRRRTEIIYTSYGLPAEVREYSAGGSSVMRRTLTDYNLTQAYLDRHIIGLPSVVHVVDENNSLVSKTVYEYDRIGEWLINTPQTAIQHDANYNSSFTTGRGNLCVIYRFNVNHPNDWGQALGVSQTGYNTNGSVIFTRDALGHQTYIKYEDSFSVAVALSNPTFAYPTTVSDPDNYLSTAQYDYNTGVVTRTQDPKGAVAVMEYEGHLGAGRLLKTTNQVNGAYTRYVYGSYGDVATFTTMKSGAPEAFSVAYFDGAGRVRAVGSDHPNSDSGYAGQLTSYDIMGRVSQQSNPQEITSGWVPTGADTGGWIWAQQQYDWQSRPTLTINPDGTTREASYNVCGCAGSAVVTIRDERGRRRRLTNDIAGRLEKVEELNWDQTVYSTTTYTYNGRDQLTNINQSGQFRTFEYDGHGRLWKRTTPEQGQTTYSYFNDDQVQTVTDARGATSTLAYNARHLPTGVTYGVTAGVAATPNVSYGYDAAGNRTSMTDGLGSTTYHYDDLSRMDWEERTFTGLGTYRLTYGYNLSGALTSVTGPSQFGSVNIGYTYDHVGRTTSVTGSGYGGVSNYINNLKYRAFGGVKQGSYGNGKTLSINYDNRLRMTRWDVAGVLGSDYEYQWEGTLRPTFARSRTDATLDRYYAYDHVGRLHVGRTGSEARAANGEGWNGQYDGPYSTGLFYDVWGNLTLKEGWGGVNPSYTATYTNNRRGGFDYDAAGNLTNDGQQTYIYDATGQQATTSGTNLTQSYDGDGVRAKKVESATTTYYLRSSVLGKQVVAEINGNGTFKRGYVYLGGQMLALQENNQVSWVHQDPVTKSQRLTSSSGSIVSWVELDPWGGEVAGSTNSQMQPHRYTSYERDGNGGDEAMFRRYESQWQRFAQPDPYEGSYNLTDPQSFNRYAYVQNDPVNFVDPSGLMLRLSCTGVNQTGEEGSAPFYYCTLVDDRWGGYNSGGGRGSVPNIGEPPPPQNPAPQQDPKSAAWERVKKGCLEDRKEQRKAAERDRRKDVDRSFLVSVGIGAGTGALWGGMTAGPLGTCAGALLGGVVGACTAIFTNGVVQIIEEKVYQSRIKQHESEDEKKCNNMANSAIGKK